MQAPLALYLASILGAVAVMLMLPKRRGNWKLLGALIGVVTLGGLWLFLARRFTFAGGTIDPGIELGAFSFHYLFSAIAIGSAVMVITNKRPVYAALWFVMVILASAGLFLTLSAEFMAFAMVLIYAGAILVTYMFVIMLASEQDNSADSDQGPEYDRVAREPFAACAAGFLLLAVLLNVAFEPPEPKPIAKADSDQTIYNTVLSDRAQQARGPALTPERLRSESDLSNVERIGLDLFRSHPLGLELAGVILLVALIGAIVIAKTQVTEQAQDPTAESGRGGASVRNPEEAGPHSAQVTQSAGSGRLGQ